MTRRRPTGDAPVSRGRRRLAAAALGIVIAFALSACGAVIDTTMTVDAGGSGSRQMTVTLSQQDLAKASGGSAAIDASVRRHLPSPLAYSGITGTDSGGITATFTLPFSSPEDYAGKVGTLLSTRTGSSAPRFAVTDSALVRGIDLQESFTSSDLLGWMFSGLIADGVVDGSQGVGSLRGEGSAAVVFAGERHTDVGDPLSYSHEENHGFDGVSMATDASDQGAITRTITYRLDAGRDPADEQRIEAFLRDATPTGGEVAAPEPGTWTMAFSGDAAAIQSDTTTALGGGATSFAVDISPSPDDPSKEVMQLTDTASCAAVCAPDAIGHGGVPDHVTAGAGYAPESMDVGSATASPVSFVLSPPITSLASHLSIGSGGDVTGTTTIVVPRSSADAVGDGFLQRYRPDPDVGTIASDAGPDSTTYTVTIAGASVEDFADRYARWAPGASVGMRIVDDGFLVRRSEYAIDPGFDALASGHRVLDGTDVTLDLPLGSWVDGAQGGSAGDGARITVVRTSSMTPAGVVAASVLALALAVGLVLLIRRRQAVAVRVGTARTRLDTLLAARRRTRLDERLAGDPPLDARAAERGSLLASPAPPAKSGGRTGALDVDPPPEGAIRTPHHGALAVEPPPAAAGTRPTLLGDRPAASTNTTTTTARTTDRTDPWGA
ncbi:hypothetical protein ITJ44_13940 [Clavibacter sp. VKM Ac-2873]|uniref:hypothetical protein n=1 Tax=Clavibacter sp. VKM Ac-2873 TaxID=2783813 RepID=UPI00188C3B1A|nr:hypothetical protein [Clavibacter sp. VKM Ac-2873]MBF4619175.1 hypothetical protein [Clavibacter sp. VKM Ac-2873]